MKTLLALLIDGYVSGQFDPRDPSLIRPTIREALDAWGDGSRPFTGDFLRAVLSNDLKGAMGRADAHSLLTLPAIVSYVYTNLPAPCQGSPENVAAWAKEHRVRRIRQQFEAERARFREGA